MTGILAAEAKLPRRERRSTQRLFEALRGRGYDGAHDSVHRFVKAWQLAQLRLPAKAYVPLSFAPGEAYQFDWSHETITLQGLPVMIKAAHMKLSHSRMPFVRVYFRETRSWCSMRMTRRSNSTAERASAAFTIVRRIRNRSSE